MLAKSAGIVLGAIQSIDYSWGEINFEFSPVQNLDLEEKCMAPAGAAYKIDIEPDDIETADTVTVIWEIG